MIGELEQQPHRLAQKVLVVWGDGWHHGVLGIIAARLLERYGKPTLVLSVDEGIARGSGRSLKGFSLYQALNACEDRLLGYGGHEQAAGLTLEATRLEEFAARINAYAAETCPQMPVEELVMDCRLRPAQLSIDLLDCLSALEPFGAGNPQPLFGLFGMRLERIEAVGGGKHLRLTLSRDGAQITAMRFSEETTLFPFAVGDVVNLAVMLDKNEFRGVVSVSVIVKDIRFADTVQEEMLSARATYDAVLRREIRVPMPTREQTAAVYRFIRQRPFNGTVDVLRHRLAATDMTYLDIYLSLQLLWEAALIEWKHRGNTEVIAVNESAQRADLSQTATARFLNGEEG